MSLAGVLRAQSEPLRYGQRDPETGTIAGTDAYVRAQGHLAGYPTCCIEAFVEDMRADRSPAKLRGGDGKGYVPCEKHMGDIR